MGVGSTVPILDRIACLIQETVDLEEKWTSSQPERSTIGWGDLSLALRSGPSHSEGCGGGGHSEVIRPKPTRGEKALFDVYCDAIVHC